MITTKSLMANVKLTADRTVFPLSPDRPPSHDSNAMTLVTWYPHNHDLGLIGGFFVPLLTGIRVVSMSPVSFLRDPLLWPRVMSKYRATHTFGMTFALDLCVRRARQNPELVAGFDLDPLKVIVNAPQPVSTEVMAAFVETFSLRSSFNKNLGPPAYGLAENTVFVTSGLAGSDNHPVVRLNMERLVATDGTARYVPGDDMELVSVGPANPGSSGGPCKPNEVRIMSVDPETRHETAPGHVGEIWVRSPSMAAGYFGNSAATVATFGAQLVDRPDEGHFLRSGDAGFVHEGNVYLTGRIKEILKIHGRNIAPTPLEATALEAVSREVIKPGRIAAVAAPIGSNGLEAAVVVAESRAPRGLCTVAALQSAAAAMKESVAAKHGVSIAVVVVVAPATLPKTTSGKLKRLAIRAMFMGGKLDIIYSSSPVLSQRGHVMGGDDDAVSISNGPSPDEVDLGRPSTPATETEQWVIDCLSAQCDVHAAGPRSSLAAFGIDSIQIQLLLSTIERDLQVPNGPPMTRP